MNAKTATQRKKDERERARAAGLLRYSRWIHPHDAPAMDALRDKLAKKREKERK